MLVREQKEQKEQKDREDDDSSGDDRLQGPRMLERQSDLAHAFFGSQGRGAGEDDDSSGDDERQSALAHALDLKDAGREK